MYNFDSGFIIIIIYVEKCIFLFVCLFVKTYAIVGCLIFERGNGSSMLFYLSRISQFGFCFFSFCRYSAVRDSSRPKLS